MRDAVRTGMIRETARIVGYLKCIMENTWIVKYEVDLNKLSKK